MCYNLNKIEKHWFHISTEFWKLFRTTTQLGDILITCLKWNQFKLWLSSSWHRKRSQISSSKQFKLKNEIQWTFGTKWQTTKQTDNELTKGSACLIALGGLKEVTAAAGIACFLGSIFLIMRRVQARLRKTSFRLNRRMSLTTTGGQSQLKNVSHCWLSCKSKFQANTKK